MRYVLFDIDGTLTAGGEGGGAGSAALNLAFEELFGKPNGFDGVRKAGKTDPIILREGFEQNGVALTSDSADRFKERYLHHLKEQLRIPSRRYRLLPGVAVLLDALKARQPDIVVGILTGNWVEGAKIKLASVGLDRSFGEDGNFALGAFGGDAPTRAELVPVAWRRLREKSGISVAPADTIIVGDTPRDVECAHANGARAVAVGTGPFSVEELIAAGADLALPDLAKTDDVLAYVLGPVKTDKENRG